MCSHQADLDHASVSECVVKCMKSIVCGGAWSMLWPLLNYDSELGGGGAFEHCAVAVSVWAPVSACMDECV